MQHPIPFHEVANIFPLMAGGEYKALVDDIAEHGLIEPIWMHDNKIIDGRNRYKACCDLGLAPEYRKWDGHGSLVAFVVSLNLKRRHLDSGQKAFVALGILPFLEAEAKERQIALAGTRPNSENLPEIFPEGAGEARQHAAAMTGTNAHYISDAKTLEEEAPDLAEQVKNGELTIPKAKQEKKKRDAKQRIDEVEQANIELPQEQRSYRVFYADPPWKYGNTMPDYFDEQAHHYTLMTVREICQMPIAELCMDDAVLFLWVTSPILEEAFDVIRAWGFKYKASFVWDKIKHNMGHYNSVRHEFLLVCVRGSCQPDVQKLFDSVQSIERTRHSEKPPIFREIIDTIYPHGPRIELFARQTSEGWDTYGNEIPG